jgi:hypothetical protein
MAFFAFLGSRSDLYRLYLVARKCFGGSKLQGTYPPPEGMAGIAKRSGNAAFLTVPDLRLRVTRARRASRAGD